MLEFLYQYGFYWIAIGLSSIGLYIVIAYSNLLKKLIGINLFQSGVFILFISLGNIHHASPPILSAGVEKLYANPVPQVLILTAIVVAVSATALGLMLILRVHDTWGSLEEENLNA